MGRRRISMNARTEAKLRRDIAAAGSAAVAKNGYVTAIDVLLGTGWVRPDKIEDWRRGRVPYLEQVIVAGLPKIGAAMRVFRRDAWSNLVAYRKQRPVGRSVIGWSRG
jgi:hypothetical protein